MPELSKPLLDGARFALRGLPLCLALLGACQSSWAAPSTLRFCAAGSPKSFDPANSDSGVDHIATLPIYSGLVDNDLATDRIIPSLAESWRISADGRSYRFKLRHGVKFHSTPWFKPTRDFNADDVLYTFNRLLDPKSPMQKAYPTISPYVPSLGWEKLIRSVERVADDEVLIQLNAVDATFLGTLGFAFAGIQSAEYGAQLLRQGKPQQLATQPVGTGPFVFKSFQPDSVIRYTRNPAYFVPNQAGVDNLVYAITVDRNVRTQRLKRNECDIAPITGSVDLAELQGDPNITVQSAPGMNIGFLAFNLKKPPLDQLAVRQALDMAIDKAAIIKTVFGPGGVVADSPIPMINWAHDASLKPPVYSPEKAKALLQSAGVKNLELSLWAMPVQRFYNPNAQLMAQMIQADWAKVGVKARIMTFEWGEYLKRVDAGEHDTALLGWNGEVEPASSAGQLACGAASASFFCDKDYDATITAAKQTLDEAQRKKLYAKAQQIAMKQLPWSPIANGAMSVAMRKNVVGFRLGVDGTIRFDGVSLR
ncbi:ABC transporter substrate-binding protein [Paucibacter sp. KBW04]|uniref:ABC transporter substrate-binding protein n=1 Tax=Paucibacter sp. KBW04 TaxID=2153361 RepID=UPI0018CC0CC9|nr:ABC transporter substrate-binding protein [Paucibacter sp. KBW04]